MRKNFTSYNFGRPLRQYWFWSSNKYSTKVSTERKKDIMEEKETYKETNKGT